MSPASILSVVVLPAPFGPSRATISERPTVSDTLSTTVRLPNRLDSAVATITSSCYTGPRAGMERAPRGRVSTRRCRGWRPARRRIAGGFLPRDPGSRRPAYPCAADALDRRIEPREELAGDARGDLGAEPAGDLVFVRDDDAVGALDGVGDRRPSRTARSCAGRSRPREMPSFSACCAASERPLHERAPGDDDDVGALAAHGGPPERQHEVRARDTRPCCRSAGTGACARGRAPGRRSGWPCAAGPRRRRRSTDTTMRMPGQCAKMLSPDWL